MTRNTLTLQNRELTAYLPARHRPPAPPQGIVPHTPPQTPARASQPGAY